MNVGTRVFDREDGDPDEAVVVDKPEDMTIADWEYEVDGETYTTAESNPDYPDDEQLVLISFLDALESDWPDWETVSPEALRDGVRERDIPSYGFPEGRLADADAADGDGSDTVEIPEEFEVIRGRLEENDFAVTLEEDAAELHVEKYDTEYVVSADGTVEGEAGLRNRVASIVSRYL
ncbi:hypothetical protein [Halapricum desulfuricans]|uniref:Uncharacterized protein n=1 Tax=Halapricum desulfuricans TaxID=2841257 RepID=A0A897N5D0_9EURY|nr:hypothetical protein [Halapricum desulfuricans]QSG07804.1 hypothetical protein HSR122_0393 [Halapricum desulfuricans]QSG13070.1 hypothetical protein HSBGL_2670 [Halapricum desulfuricans]